jgi:two-component system cell cycle response regulator
MPALICVDTSAELAALTSVMAQQNGLRHIVLASTDDAVKLLQGDEDCALMIIGPNIPTGDAMRLLDGSRLSVQQITLPIGFVVAHQSAELAATALRSGATEVIRQSDTAALADFVQRFAVAPSEPVSKGRVLLVEDSDSQAAFDIHLCTAMGLQVDRCESAEDAELLLDNGYDLIIIDVILKGMKSGIALLREVRQRDAAQERVPVLVMSGFDDVTRRIDILRSGADDYLGKPFIPEEFIWRVRRLLDLYALRQASNGRPHPSQGDSPNWPVLTARETQISTALCTGASDKQIAGDLGISYWTVRSHIQSIFRKLGVLNRRELMVKMGNHSENGHS